MIDQRAFALMLHTLRALGRQITPADIDRVLPRRGLALMPARRYRMPKP